MKARAANDRQDITGERTDTCRTFTVNLGKVPQRQYYPVIRREKGEKCGEVVDRKISCYVTPPLVTVGRGKPSPVQEQISAKSFKENGRSLEVMSNYHPREMVIT